MNSSQLKGLQTKIDTLTIKSNNLKQQQSQISKELADTNETLSKLKHQVELLTKDFVVSEHAILRYLQKTLDLDLDAISKAILAIPNLETTYATLGNAKYKHPSGLTLVIKDKVVITCTSPTKDTK